MTTVVDVSLCPVCPSSFGENILSPLRPGGPSPSPYMTTSPRLGKNLISQPVVIGLRKRMWPLLCLWEAPSGHFARSYWNRQYLLSWLPECWSSHQFEPAVREDLFRNKTKGQEKRRGTNKFIRFFAYVSLSELSSPITWRALYFPWIKVGLRHLDWKYVYTICINLSN